MILNKCDCLFSFTKLFINLLVVVSEYSHTCHFFNILFCCMHRSMTLLLAYFNNRIQPCFFHHKHVDNKRTHDIVCGDPIVIHVYVGGTKLSIFCNCMVVVESLNK